MCLGTWMLIVICLTSAWACAAWSLWQVDLSARVCKRLTHAFSDAEGLIHEVGFLSGNPVPPWLDVDNEFSIDTRLDEIQVCVPQLTSPGCVHRLVDCEHVHLVQLLLPW